MKKQKRIYGEETKRHSVTMSDEDWKKLIKVGNGNASQGIRNLLIDASIKCLGVDCDTVEIPAELVE